MSRLIDADAFKEQLESAYEYTELSEVIEMLDKAPTVDIKPFANFTFDKDELEQIVRDRLIEPIKNGELVVKEERSQGEWVSVKDRLPDKDGDYIVTTEMFLPVNNFIREVEVTEYNIVSGFCCETHATKVIAWQELILPNPYKEAENEDSN